MDDQQRARVIFGRCVLAGGLLKVGTSAGLCVAAHAMYNVECDQAGSTNSAAGLVAGLAVVQVIIPVYLRLAALTNRHRLGCVLIILFDSSARPASSKLGRTLILTLTLTLTFHPHPHPNPHPDPNQVRPAFSKLGRPSEPLCTLAALLTGELIGYTYESHWRR